MFLSSNPFSGVKLDLLVLFEMKAIYKYENHYYDDITFFGDFFFNNALPVQIILQYTLK